MLAAIMRHRGAAFSCRCEAATSPANHALTYGCLRHDCPHQQRGSCERRALLLWRLVWDRIPGAHFGSHHGATHRHPVVLAWISADLAMKFTRIDLDSVFGCVFSLLASRREGLLGNPLRSASCSTPLAAIINSADLKR